MYVLGDEKPQFKDLENYVVIKYATTWKQLGKNLNINEDLLNIIEKDNPLSCENCCSKMLSDWLDLTPEASWGMLFDAVEKLQDKLNTTPDTVVDELPDTVKNLCTAADKLPDTVEKLDSAADKLPKAVDQLWEAIDKLSKTVVDNVQIANTNLDNLAGNYGSLQINFSSYIRMCIYVTARFAIWPILKQAAHFIMGQPILKLVSPINK